MCEEFIYLSIRIRLSSRSRQKSIESFMDSLIRMNRLNRFLAFSYKTISKKARPTDVQLSNNMKTRVTYFIY